jgi:hypothetical protein
MLIFGGVLPVRAIVYMQFNASFMGVGLLLGYWWSGVVT